MCFVIAHTIIPHSLWLSAFSLRRRLIFHFEHLSALFAKHKPRKTVCMQCVCGYESNVATETECVEFICLFACNGIVQNGIRHFKVVD